MVTSESSDTDTRTTEPPTAEDFVDHKKRMFFAVASLAGFSFLAWVAYNMPVGTPTNPGPGLFPLIVSILGLGSSLLVFLESAVQLRRSEQRPEGSGTTRAVIVFVSLLIAFATLLPILGFYVCAFLFSMFSVRITGDCSWIKSALSGVAIGIATSVLALEFIGLRIQAWPGF